jgi:hypothetical protein
MKATMKATIAILGLSGLGACSGMNSYVKADESKYPISLSGELRGADGQLLQPQQKKHVGTFELEYKTWTTLWTLIPIVNRTRDISDEVNEQVAKAGGDAVVGLDVSSKQCGLNYATLLGILPGCGNMYLRGDIIKVTP